MTIFTVLPLVLIALALIFWRISRRADYKRHTLIRYAGMLLTNWINYVGLYLSFCVATLINNLVDHGSVGYVEASVFEIMFAAPVFFTIYGIGYIVLAILVIFITDIVALKLAVKNVYAIALGQWLIASVVLTYLSLTGWDITFAVAIISIIFITQILRARKLQKIISSFRTQHKMEKESLGSKV